MKKVTNRLLKFSPTLVQPFTSLFQVEIMETAEFSTVLKPFFTQTPEKSVEGKPYSRNTVKANSFRAGQIFSGSLQRKPFSIFRDKVFKLANKALDPSLNDLARQGLISFKKHKRPISSEDLEVLYAENQLGRNIPESLANSARFNPFSASEREGVKNNAR